jgi:hypothetical protein
MFDIAALKAYEARLLKLKQRLLLLSDPQYFVKMHGWKICHLWRAEVAKRFTANKVGGNWRVMDERAADSITNFIAKAGTDSNKIGKRQWYHAQMMDRMRETPYTGSKVDSGGEFDLKEGGTPDTKARLAKYYWETVVLKKIQQEDVRMVFVSKGANVIRFHIGMGNIDYLDSGGEEGLTRMPPPIQMQELMAGGNWSPDHMGGYYTWRIQEFGTASYSTDSVTSLAGKVKHGFYPWIMPGFYSPNRPILYHPGRRGRHFYLTLLCTYYPQDREMMSRVFKDLVAEITTGGV